MCGNRADEDSEPSWRDGWAFCLWDVGAYKILSDVQMRPAAKRNGAESNHTKNSPENIGLADKLPITDG